MGLTNRVVSQLNHSFIVGSIGMTVEGDLIIDKQKAGCEDKGVKP
ncbi:hypothetical protein TUM4630_13670 [Shewanella algidipiscicola]|uniref:Uncharacterized protein n=1 Tax=Shewanella algidipiscicola TaxID=614070 RepID=A0ABQ4PD88_9GAMM|nr:hypothetical protein TUM4630_13670 [Shewanella algidipiscicola]